MADDRTSAEHAATVRAERAVEPRPLAWWGMMLAVAVLATTYGAMYFSYVYIRIAVRHWPPPGVHPPELALPAASVGALLASCGALWIGLRRARQGRLGAERSGLLAALALGGAHVALLAADWARADFTVAAHSYAALYYVLPAIHVAALSVAALMAAVHVAMSFRPHDLPRRAVGLRALGAYWYATAIGGAALLAVVYLTPHVWAVT